MVVQILEDLDSILVVETLLIIQMHLVDQILVVLDSILEVIVEAPILEAHSLIPIQILDLLADSILDPILGDQTLDQIVEIVVEDSILVVAQAIQVQVEDQDSILVAVQMIQKEALVDLDLTLVEIQALVLVLLVDLVVDSILVVLEIQTVLDHQEEGSILDHPIQEGLVVGSTLVALLVEVVVVDLILEEDHQIVVGDSTLEVHQTTLVKSQRSIPIHTVQMQI